ncbi:hypothetical protein [Desulfoferula mesophila]
MDDNWRNNGDWYHVSCPRCGIFNISHTASRMIHPDTEEFKERGSKERAMLSSWLRENEPPEMIHSTFFNDPNNPLGKLFKNAKMPTFEEKEERLLVALSENIEFVGQRFDWDTKKKELEARAWAVNQRELEHIFESLAEKGFIKGGVLPAGTMDDSDAFIHTDVKLTSKGTVKVEQLKEGGQGSQQAFVAMWFSPKTEEAWLHGFEPAILAAQYSPMKIDLAEFNERIDERILFEIKRSRFLVADLTGHRGGVYYEAGFAQGRNIPVIWTCREDHFKYLHFDVRQYKCIKWSQGNLPQLKDDLTKRIEATIGLGKYLLPKELIS